MSTFHFRLATLLQLRQSVRDQCRVQLAESQRADAEIESQLTRLDLEQKQLQRECRAAAGPGPVDLRRLLESRHYAATLRAQEIDLHGQRQALRGEIDHRRQALLEADRDVRTLEKLRENQSQTHRHIELRQEGKRLDEAALQTTGPWKW